MKENKISATLCHVNFSFFKYAVAHLVSTVYIKQLQALCGSVCGKY